MEATTPEAVQDPTAPKVEGTGAIVTRVASVETNLLDPANMTDEAKAELDRAGVYRETLLRFALRQTSVSQWVNFKGEGADAKDSFYPMGAAADAMFAFFGLHWSTPGPADELFKEQLYKDDDGDRWWLVKSKLWRGERFICHGEGARKIGSGFAKNEIHARMDAMENLKSRAARAVLGLGSKSLADYKALGLDLSTCRVATFQDRGSNPDEATINWGNAKGTKVKDLNDQDLAYYTGKYEKDVKDPTKAKYKPERMLAALKAEAERRAAAPTISAEEQAEFEAAVIALREEMTAQSVKPDAMEKYLNSIDTLAKAKAGLEHYRGKRKSKAPPEPGSEG